MAQNYYQVRYPDGRMQTMTEEELRQCNPELYASHKENTNTSTVQFMINDNSAQAQQCQINPQQTILHQAEQPQQQIVFNTMEGQIQYQLPLQSTQYVIQHPDSTAVAQPSHFIGQQQQHVQTSTVEYPSLAVTQTQHVYYATPVSEETRITTIVNQPHKVKVEVGPTGIIQQPQQISIPNQQKIVNQYVQPQTQQRIMQTVQHVPQKIIQPAHDNQIVQLPDGREMTYGEFKRLQQILQQRNKQVQQVATNDISNNSNIANTQLQNRQNEQVTIQQTFSPNNSLVRQLNNRRNEGSPLTNTPNLVNHAINNSPQININDHQGPANRIQLVTPKQIGNNTPVANQSIVQGGVKPNMQQQHMEVQHKIGMQNTGQPIFNTLLRQNPNQQLPNNSNMIGNNELEPNRIVKGPLVRTPSQQEVNVPNQNIFNGNVQQAPGLTPIRGAINRRRPAQTNNFQGNRVGNKGVRKEGFVQSQAQSPVSSTSSSSSNNSKSEPTSPGSDEPKPTARMLIMLENGEQRLITFSLPRDACTVEELLEQVLLQVHVDFVPGLGNVQYVRNRGADIEYYVTIGGANSNAPSGQSGSSIEKQTQGTNEKQLKPTGTPNVAKQTVPAQQNQPNTTAQANTFQQNQAPPTKQSSFQQSFCLNLQTYSSDPPPQQQPTAFQYQVQQQQKAKVPVVEKEEKPPVKEDEDSLPLKEVDIPRYVAGMLALCSYCGYTSVDFNKCQRCKRKLPDDPKTIPISSLTGSSNRKSVTSDGGDKMMPKITIDLKRGPNRINNNVKPRGRRGRMKVPDPEPEILTLSSDDEETKSKEENSLNQSQIRMKEQLCLIDIEPLVDDLSENGELSDLSDVETETTDSTTDIGLSKEGEKTQDMEGNVSSMQDSFILRCKTLRIGSYRCIPNDDIIINGNFIKVSVPNKDNKNVTIKIKRKHIVRLLVHFGKKLPLLIIYAMPSLGKRIRELLDMKHEENKSTYYYNPASAEHGVFRRLFFMLDDVPENMTSIMGNLCRDYIGFLSDQEAQDLMIKACVDVKLDQNDRKTDLQNADAPDDSNIENSFQDKTITRSSLQNSNDQKCQKLVYPRNGKGGITINSVDYACLATDQFLNDVIIDFYLKYILENMLSDEERQKYHVFSTFFYNRLTLKKQVANKKKMLPFENDPSLTGAQRRHMRVRRWTRNINIFEKDYVIIPINESSHWFLAIICFPGLDMPRRMDDNKPVQVATPAEKKEKGKNVQIGNTVISPVKKELKINPIITVKSEEGDDEMSDRDEAEADESDLENDSESAHSEDDPPPPTEVVPKPTQLQQRVVVKEKRKPREPIKQPCILIFDSLANGGNSRAKVVATLRDYLTWEYREKFNSNMLFTRYNMRGHIPKVPQQNNFTDCGLYVLQYVETFVKKPIKDYHIPIKELKDWFDEYTVTKKREEISIIIKDLMTEYDLDSSQLPDVAFPTLNGTLVENLNQEQEMQEEIENTQNEDEEMVDEDEHVNMICEVEGESTVSEKTKSPTSSENEFESKSVNSSKQANCADNQSLIPHSKSNRDTMSYLKAKRIIRHKPSDSAVSEIKKQKLSSV